MKRVLRIATLALFGLALCLVPASAKYYVNIPLSYMNYTAEDAAGGAAIDTRGFDIVYTFPIVVSPGNCFISSGENVNDDNNRPDGTQLTIPNCPAGWYAFEIKGGDGGNGTGYTWWYSPGDLTGWFPDSWGGKGGIVKGVFYYDGGTILLQAGKGGHCRPEPLSSGGTRIPLTGANADWYGGKAYAYQFQTAAQVSIDGANRWLGEWYGGGGGGGYSAIFTSSSNSDWTNCIALAGGGGGGGSGGSFSTAPANGNAHDGGAGGAGGLPSATGGASGSGGDSGNPGATGGGGGGGGGGGASGRNTSGVKYSGGSGGANGVIDGYPGFLTSPTYGGYVGAGGCGGGGCGGWEIGGQGGQLTAGGVFSPSGDTNGTIGTPGSSMTGGAAPSGGSCGVPGAGGGGWYGGSSGSAGASDGSGGYAGGGGGSSFIKAGVYSLSTLAATSWGAIFPNGNSGINTTPQNTDVTIPNANGYAWVMYLGARYPLEGNNGTYQGPTSGTGYVF